jgi:hypothetical protein
MLFGAARTWPRSIPSFSMPRNSTPTLSPAWPWSSSLRNISMPVTVVLVVSLRPTISTVLVDLDDAALDAAGGDGAAAGDGEHVLDRHQEGLVDIAHGLGISLSIASIRLPMALTPSGLPSRAAERNRG